MNCYPFNYPYCDFDFSEWNPVQAKCLPFFDEDCNLVVSASTASGKTVIAEAIMGYELSRSERAKAVYVSPLKAIGVEKHGKWSSHSTFEKYPQCVLSSDSNAKVSEIENARLIVSTVESMDLKCRAKEHWIGDVKVLVFDEAHLIGDESRGAAGEAMVMELSSLNPDCRIICLSGTMSNYLEVARWLKACNGKTTRFVNSNWRPSELVKKVECYDDASDELAKIRKKAKKMHDDGLKMLVFVHSKQKGEAICHNLREYGIPCAFYNAGARTNDKVNMLIDFKSKYSGLDVLVCTSALGMGVDI